MAGHRYVLDQFHRRLLSAVTRSSLLKATVSRTGRLIDCSRLESVGDSVSHRVLRAIVESENPMAVDFRLRFTHTDSAPDADDEDREASPDDEIVREHRAIYDSLDRRIARFAEMVKRETGVQSLWLGYPLLYVVAGEGDSQQWILAPVFLWPVSIRLDHNQEGRVLIGRERAAGPVKFNRAMANWVQRQLNLQLRGPEEDQLEQLSWGGVQSHLSALADQFHDPPAINCEASLEPVTATKLLNPQHSPRVFNSAALGIYRWQNEALLADIDALKGLQEVDGVASAFTSGVQLSPSADAARPSEDDRFQVFDADFSQEQVIWQARNSPGLIVQGPPGTGKSQTIANIIADALAHHRTVLMVCQKYAATRVVFEKLKQVGLDSLCLEVTDAERSRRPVFQAVRDQVDSLPTTVTSGPSPERTRLACQITQLEGELDQYAQAMHERDTTSGLSYRRIKALEGETYSEFPTVRPLQSLQTLAADMSFPEIESISHAIEEAGRLYGRSHPLTNPWRFRAPHLLVTAVLKTDVISIIGRLQELNAQHQKQIEDRGAGVEISGSLCDFSEITARAIPVLRDIESKPSSLRLQLLRAWLAESLSLSPEIWSNRERNCMQAIALAKQVVATPLDPVCDSRFNSVPDTEVEAIHRHAQVVLRYETRWWRFFSTRFHTARRALLDFHGDRGAVVIWRVARQIAEYAQARSLRSQLALTNARLVPKLRPARDEHFQLRFPQLAVDQLRIGELLCRNEYQHTWLSGLLDCLSEKDVPFVAGQLLAEVEKSVERLPIVEQLFNCLGMLREYLQDEALVPAQQLIRAGASLTSWLDGLESGLNRIDELIAWELSRGQHMEPLATIISVLEEYESHRQAGARVAAPPHDICDDDYGRWWLALVKYTAALAWQADIHRKYPTLMSTTPGNHSKKVQKLRKLVALKRNLEANAIREVWLAEQVQHRTAPWKRMFQLRRSKKGEAKRLREAVKLSLPHGLLNMRPCWLVNPATAAEIFPLEQGMFDLVIFDEASQCPVEHAIPSIYRGKTVVISGDEKQLPPTGFFSSTWSIEEPDDVGRDEEATDEVVSGERQLQQLGVQYLLNVEDLLAAGVGVLPEQSLTVHYRSRHPALIEFSNRAFYNGRLEAPPAQISSCNGYRPIRYHEVNGLYERRTNRDEAKHVIATLRDLWNTSGECPTTGVVTFNQPQRDLIEDLLEEECLRDRAFRACFQQEVARQEDNQDVGFFIKNLENVQGDERDVMIFSTTFGRDSTGRFYRRFGPVGQVEGERRLNVAVTRAKKQVIVVGSMPIDEIATTLSADLAPGSQLTPAGYLQLYLAYAKAVSDANAKRIERILDRVGRPSFAMTTGEPESPFELDVQSVLEKLGFTVHSQIGDSGFRIDLAVVARDAAHGYVLGIECDGATYHSDRSARLRDVWRAQILRERGWRLHRIWSTRWWYHRGEEIEALKLALDDAQASLEKKHLVSAEVTSEQAQSSDEEHRESWQMTLAEWKLRCEELRERSDEDSLRALGGMGTDSAHRYRVEQALKAGKAVPKEVLADYPNLLSPNQPVQRELFGNAD